MASGTWPGGWCGEQRAAFLAELPDGSPGLRQVDHAEAFPAVIDREASIEMHMDIDARPGVAAAARARLELQDPVPELERIVVTDGALIFEAADPLEVDRGGRPAPSGVGLRRRLGEARVIAWEKPIQDALGVGEGSRAR